MYCIFMLNVCVRACMHVLSPMSRSEELPVVKKYRLFCITAAIINRKTQ